MKIYPNNNTNPTRDELNAPIVDMILSILKGKELSYNKIEIFNRITVINYKYLLGQIIRQYIIPERNWHISKAAYALWQEITDQNMEEFSYNEAVIPKKSINIPKYAGNTRVKVVDKDIVVSQKFAFNEVFISEHTVPVSDVVSVLLSMGNPSFDRVKKILDKIHITRMLKIEDRRIKITRSRIESYNKFHSDSHIDLEKEPSDVLFQKLVDYAYCDLKPVQIDISKYPCLISSVVGNSRIEIS